MSFSWIDKYVYGVIDYCYSKNIYEIYNTLEIVIKKLDKDDPFLKNCEALYIRSYFGLEIVFLRDDLDHQYERFVLSHELGHAILHTEIAEAFFNKTLINSGKLERQAHYFAYKLLDLKLDMIYHYGLTTGQIANDLCVAENSLSLILRKWTYKTIYWKGNYHEYIYKEKG